MDSHSLAGQSLPSVADVRFPRLPQQQPSPQRPPGQLGPQQLQAPAPDTLPVPEQTSTKRRRTSAAGSRGVSNLTPEQLTKKRANDREAQRAIRERTKGQIEALEQKIQQLTSQRPYQELQDIVRQKDHVEAENQEIKRRLASVQTLIQPLLDGSIANHRASSLEQSYNGLTPTTPSTETAASHHLPSNPPRYERSSHQSSASIASNFSPSLSTIKQTPTLPHASFSTPPSTFSAVNAFTHQNNANTPLSARPPDDKLALDFLMQSRHSSRDPQSQHEPTPSSTNLALPMDPICRTPAPLTLDPSIPVCAMPLRNTPPLCPLDTLLLDFLADRRKEALNGTPTSELIGPAYPSFASLVDPARRIYKHPLSKVFTDMLSTFPDISTLPEQVAILHMMFLFMRYTLSPTPSNHDRLPHWFQPRPSQLLTPHPAWVDYLPWPRMRDTMTQIYPQVPFDEFFIPYTTTVSLNWPEEAGSVLAPVRPSPNPMAHPSPTHPADPGLHPGPGVMGGSGTLSGQVGHEGPIAAGDIREAGELALNPRFEEHMMDLNNWSLGPAFARAHPALAVDVRIRDTDADASMRRRS